MHWTAMHERAAESIEFIRETMVRSASFTAVPGQGGMAMGVIGVVAALAGGRAETPREWLATWLIAAVVAAPIGLVATIVKARRNTVALWSASGRRFMQGFLPALVAGAALTWSLVSAGRIELLAPMWLLLYGAGILAGATASISVLTWLGAEFMLLGCGAVLTGGRWTDLWLGAGFGGLQIVYGVIIARKHGG
ncbi:MAG TPA: hypothetical protein VI485_25755 [Vicinamibacterales bacterium]|nr:hypothetical protein [Vicinamibacterales bacterium]